MVSFSPQRGKSRLLSLPARWPLNGIAFAGGALLLAPGEKRTLGEGKPFLALSPADARVRWQWESDAIQWTPPAASERLVCTVNSLGEILAVHPADGAPRWRRLPRLEGYPHRGIPPVLSASFVVFTTPSGTLRWFERGSGREAGAFAPPAGALEHAPACEGDSAFLCAGDTLYHLNLRTSQAEALFRVPRRSSLGYFFAPPIVTPQGVLILHAEDPLYALSLVDVSTKEAHWTLPLPRHPYFAPAVSEEILALPDREGSLLLMDLRKGEILSRLPLGQEDPAAAPLFFKDDLYLLARSGALLRFTPHRPRESHPDSKEALQLPSQRNKEDLSVRIYGDVTNAIIVTGDGNTVIHSSDEKDAQD